MITLYVDDLLIAGSTVAEVESLKRQLAEQLGMKDCSQANVCLRREIERDCINQALKITQSDYAKRGLERFGMGGCKAISTPIIEQIEARHLDGNAISEILYRQAFGCMMYSMISKRSDLFFVVV